MASSTCKNLKDEFGLIPIKDKGDRELQTSLQKTRLEETAKKKEVMRAKQKELERLWFKYRKVSVPIPGRSKQWAKDFNSGKAMTMECFF